MTTDTLGEFTAQRARLLGLAYRLLGSADDAEDVVQEAFLRWDRADRVAIAAPSAWLAKVVTNLCLNRLTSARARREVYAGLWLPEPVLTEGGDLRPLETAAQRESVSMALLMLLERLTPAERAVARAGAGPPSPGRRRRPTTSRPRPATAPARAGRPRRPRPGSPARHPR